MAKQTMEELRGAVRGPVIIARRRGLRRRTQGLQRNDRPTPERHRPRGGRRRRDRGRRLLPRERPRPFGPGRIAQRARVRHERRRRRDRPGEDEGDPGRPGGPDGARRGRLHVGRRLPRHLSVRPDDDGRHHLDDGDRRPHPRGRHRPSVARLRALDRQPALRRRRHGRRALPRREREGEPGPLLGAPGRRRQLRRRHVVRVPAAPGEGRLRRPLLLRAVGGPAGARVLPPVHRDGSGGDGSVLRVADRAAAPVHSREAARRALLRDRGLLGRAAREGRAGDAADPEGRARRRRADDADALPGAEQRLRRAGAGRPPALLEDGLRDRHHRRGDRGAPRARAEGPRRQLDGAHLSDQRGRATGSPPTRPRSPTATPASRRSSPACGRTPPTTRRTSSG